MWVQLIIDTITNPRETARWLIGLNPPMALRWQGFVLLTLLSTVLYFAAALIAGGDLWAEVGSTSPFLMVAVQLMTNLVTILLINGIGRWAGGLGQFADALLLVVWIQAMLFVLQLVQFVATLLAPILLTPIAMVSVVLSFWLLSNFTTELHGFQSVLRVFGAIVGVLFLIALMLAPFLAPYLPVPRP
jgi:hypothetical protein